MVEMVDLGDAVKVGAIFEAGGKLKPVWFAYNGRQLAIERVTYSWLERDGAAKVYHFAVKVGATIYELTFEAAEFRWRLARSYVE